MRRLMASLLAGVVLFGAAGTGLAQEIVKVAGIDATRVVIAPPRSDLARIIKTGLHTAYYEPKRAPAPMRRRRSSTSSTVPAASSRSG